MPFYEQAIFHLGFSASVRSHLQNGWKRNQLSDRNSITIVVMRIRIEFRWETFKRISVVSYILPGKYLNHTESHQSHPRNAFNFNANNKIFQFAYLKTA